MKIFISGGTGYVGAAIAKELESAGHELTLLSRSGVGANFVRGTLENPETYSSELIGQDVLIHNALIWPEEASEDRLRDVQASSQLFERAARAGIGHIIYTSSTAVHRPFQPTMNERTAIRTNDEYGAAKACGELQLSSICEEYGLNFTVIRPSMVIGRPVPGSKLKVDRRFQAMLELARSGADIPVAAGDGRQLAPLPELARAYRAVVEQAPHKQVYIYAAGRLTTWEEVAHRVIELTHSSSKVVLETAAVPPMFDVGKIERDLGIAADPEPALSDHLSALANMVLGGSK